MDKVGWTFSRDDLVKGDFFSGIANRMPSWPKSIKRLNLNYDRALSFSKNIDDDDIKKMISGLKEVICGLDSLELNFCGIGYLQPNLSF